MDVKGGRSKPKKFTFIDLNGAPVRIRTVAPRFVVSLPVARNLLPMEYLGVVN